MGEAIDGALQDPRRNGGGAMVEVALDNLAFVNATYGWDAGDELIALIGDALRAAVPDSGTVAALGGARFGIVVSDDEAAVAERVAEMIELVRGCRLRVGHGTACTTASIGVVPFGGRSLTVHDVFVQADLAIKKAKEGGRNRAAYADAGLREALEASFRCAEQIREALSEDGFHLLAQPIQPITTDAIHGWELLAHLRSDSRDLIGPAEFVPIAERFGLMEEVDRWMIRRAITLIGERDRRRDPVCLYVNVSARSVHSGEFASFVADEIADAGIDPASLTFEIADAVAVGALPAVHSVGESLRGIGCRLLLEHFGVDYGSLVQLMKLPLDLLKIDKEFINNLAWTPIDQVAVEAVTRLAHAARLQVVAAYVPDYEVMRMLARCGVDYVQGFWQTPISEVP